MGASNKSRIKFIDKMRDNIKIGDRSLFEIESYCCDTPCDECLLEGNKKSFICTLVEVCRRYDTEQCIDITHGLFLQENC